MRSSGKSGASLSASEDAFLADDAGPASA
jgi:hypothetical protein